MKNSSKTRSSIFYVMSVLFFVAAFITIVCGDYSYVTVILSGLGATFLILGSSFKKSKKNNEQ